MGAKTHTHTRTHVQEQVILGQQRDSVAYALLHILAVLSIQENKRVTASVFCFSLVLSHALALAHDAGARRHAASLRVGLQALGAPPLLNGEPGIIVAAK